MSAPSTSSSPSSTPPLEGTLFSIFDRECRRFHTNLASLTPSSSATERDQIGVDMVCLSLLLWPDVSLEGVEQVRTQLQEGLLALRRADVCGHPADRSTLIRQSDASLSKARETITHWTGFQEGDLYVEGLHTLHQHHEMLRKFPDTRSLEEREKLGLQHLQHWMARLKAGTGAIRTHVDHAILHMNALEKVQQERTQGNSLGESLESMFVGADSWIADKAASSLHREMVGTQEPAPVWTQEDRDHLQEDAIFLRAVADLNSEMFRPLGSTPSLREETQMPMMAYYNPDPDLPLPSSSAPPVEEAEPSLPEVPLLIPLSSPTGVPTDPLPSVTTWTVQQQQDFQHLVVELFLKKVPQVEEWYEQFYCHITSRAKDVSPLGSFFKLLDDLYNSRLQYVQLSQAYPDLADRMNRKEELAGADLVHETIWPSDYWGSPQELCTSMFTYLSPRIQFISQGDRQASSVTPEPYLINALKYSKHMEQVADYIESLYTQSPNFRSLVERWDATLKEHRKWVEHTHKEQKSPSVVVKGFLELVWSVSHNSDRKLTQWAQTGPTQLREHPSTFPSDSQQSQPSLQDVLGISVNETNVKPFELGSTLNPYGVNATALHGWGGSMDKISLYMTSLGTGVMSHTLRHVSSLLSQALSRIQESEMPRMLMNNLPIWTLESVVCRLFPTLLGVAYKQMVGPRPDWLSQFLARIPFIDSLNIHTLTSLVGLLSTAIFASFSIQSTTQVILESGVPQQSIYGMMLYAGLHVSHSYLLHPFRLRGPYKFHAYVLDSLIGVLLSTSIQVADKDQLRPEIVDLRRQMFLMFSCMTRIALSSWPSLNLSVGEEVNETININIHSIRTVVDRTTPSIPAALDDPEYTVVPLESVDPLLEAVSPQFPELVKKQNALVWDLQQSLYHHKGWSQYLVDPTPLLKRWEPSRLFTPPLSKEWKQHIQTAVELFLQSSAPL